VKRLLNEIFFAPDEEFQFKYCDVCLTPFKTFNNTALSGKSLHISKLKNKVNEKLKVCRNTTIRFLEKNCRFDDVMQTIMRNELTKNGDAHFMHIDITPAVKSLNLIDV